MIISVATYTSMSWEVIKKNLSRAISRNLKKIIFNFLRFMKKRLKIVIFGLSRVKPRRELVYMNW